MRFCWLSFCWNIYLENCLKMFELKGTKLIYCWFSIKIYNLITFLMHSRMKIIQLWILLQKEKPSFVEFYIYVSHYRIKIKYNQQLSNQLKIKSINILNSPFYSNDNNNDKLLNPLENLSIHIFFSYKFNRYVVFFLFVYCTYPGNVLWIKIK